MPEDRDTDASFAEIVAAHTGAGFVDRTWLETEVESALDTPGCRYVLLTAEPGAGKTCLIAAMAARDPTRPRYFARRDSATPLTGGGARSFLLAVGHQLARHRPRLFRPEGLDVAVRQHVDTVRPGGRAVALQVGDLTVSPFFPTAVEVDQTVGEVAGEVVGAEIGRLTVDPRTLGIDDLAHMALIGPAVALAAEDPHARIVVLVDALDEVAGDGPDGLVDWLEHGRDLPSNVRLVLTSRPDQRLELFLGRREGQVRPLPLHAGSPGVRRDLATYAGQVLDTEATARAVAERGTTIDELADTVARRAEGNFAYLVAYGRALTEAMRRLDDELRDRLLSFADVPVGLDRLYGLFVASAQKDISRMGPIRIVDPVTGGTTHCSPWEDVGQPVLGVLAVAREPLTVEQLRVLSRVPVWPRHVAAVVERLTQFLDGSTAGVRLFHSSLPEFLLGERLRREHPGWAFEEQEWHESIVLGCLGPPAGWGGLDWSGVEPYGVRHAAAHLARCREPFPDRLPALVTPALRREQRRVTGTDGAFLSVVDLATERITSGRFPSDRALPEIVFLGVAARYTSGAATGAPPEVVGLLARVGRVDEAVHHVRAQPPSLRRVEGLRAVLRHAPADEADEADEEHRRDLAITLAHDARDVPAPDDRRRAVEIAAVALAPYALAEARRLAEIAEGLHRDRGEGSTVADDVARAAARTAPPERVVELVTGMSTARAAAFLDAAEHATDTPDRRRLLALAEEHLDTEDRDAAVLCRARLAVAWAPLDEPRGAAWADRAAHGIVMGSPDEVEALRRLAVLWPARARALLAVCDGLADAVAAARLWAEWGEARRATALLDPAALEDRQLPAAATAVARVAPRHAAALLDEALARVEPAGHTNPMDARWRTESLAAIALALAPLDLDRALDVAREVTGREFGQDGTEHAAALAGMAGALLDAGRPERAGELLAACLAELDAPPPLAATEVPAAVPYRVADGRRAPAPGLQDSLFLSMWPSGVYTSWLWRSRRRLDADAVSVVRDVLPGPHTVGSPHCWERTVRHWAEAVAARRPGSAERLLARVEDPAERAVGLAGLGACAWRAGDAEAARRWWDDAGAALRATPRFAWKVDRVAPIEYFNRNKVTMYAAPGSAPAAVETDTEDVLAYVLPDRRAAFEVALRRGPVGDPEFRGFEGDSAFLRRAYHDAMTGAASREILERVEPGAAWPAREIAFLRDEAGTRTGDDPLSRAVRTGLVAAERILCERGARGPDGRRRDVPVPPALTVADPADAGLLHVLGLRAGLPVAERLVEAAGDLLLIPADPMYPTAHRAYHLAALAVGALAPVDAGAAGDLAATLAAVLDAREDPTSRSLGRARLVESPAADGIVPVSDVDAAAGEIDATNDQRRRDQLLETLYPVLLRRRPERAARLLATALRSDWTGAMALLEWATPSLDADTVEALVAAFDRARRFGPSVAPG